MLDAEIAVRLARADEREEAREPNDEPGTSAGGRPAWVDAPAVPDDFDPFAEVPAQLRGFEG